jgi:cytochrome c biogenesis protein CcmG, thiol:disulfide interchange protein DsbE
VLAVVAILVVLPGCTRDAEPMGTVPATNAATASALPTIADDLPQIDLSGFHDLMGQLRGTPVVVNFWAAWCIPCRTEVPLLVDAHATYGDRVQFLGVDMQDFRSGARSFMDDQGMTYPSVFDPTNVIGVSYGLFAPPMTQFWGADGTIVSTVPGQISATDLQAGIESITSSGTSSGTS